ncbi:MAG: hypothetical protein ACRDL7_01260 [Gaiellaceae bacterium]
MVVVHLLYNFIDLVKSLGLKQKGVAGLPVLNAWPLLPPVQGVLINTPPTVGVAGGWICAGADPAEAGEGGFPKDAMMLDS